MALGPMVVANYQIRGNFLLILIHKSGNFLGTAACKFATQGTTDDQSSASLCRA